MSDNINWVIFRFLEGNFGLKIILSCGVKASSSWAYVMRFSWHMVNNIFILLNYLLWLSDAKWHQASWSRQWPVTCSAPCHCLHQCWTLRNKCYWNLNQHTQIFIYENVFENVSKILPFRSKLNVLTHSGLVMPYDYIKLGQHWFR